MICFRLLTTFHFSIGEIFLPFPYETCVILSYFLNMQNVSKPKIGKVFSVYPEEHKCTLVFQHYAVFILKG